VRVDGTTGHVIILDPDQNPGVPSAAGN
jgi:hypothetical protein